MGFFDKIRASFARFMSGRYGADQLSLAMVVTALVLTLAGSLLGLFLLTLLADALLIVAFVRMLSKNRYQRAHENQVYIEKTQKMRPGGDRMVQPGEKQQKIPLLHLPQVQGAPAHPARSGECDDHMQKLRRKV